MFYGPYNKLIVTKDCVEFSENGGKDYLNILDRWDKLVYFTIKIKFST